MLNKLSLSVLKPETVFLAPLNRILSFVAVILCLMSKECSFEYPAAALKKAPRSESPAFSPLLGTSVEYLRRPGPNLELTGKSLSTSLSNELSCV